MFFRSKLLVALGILAGAGLAVGEPVAVKIVAGQLLRAGKPYFIKGVGGEQRLDEAARRGGNSVRTWSTDGLDKTLAEAKKAGLTVAAGIWLESECGWFSYHNSGHREKQLARVREQIRQHRDHPALLAWGLGNECDGDGRNADYWQQLEKLAQLAHQEDPAHPVFTAVAGITKERAAGLNEHVPSLDFLGINTYGGLLVLRDHALQCGWKRPYAVTEFGARGFWESGRTKWGSPIEALPGEKADFLRNAYQKAIAPGHPCLGGYAFVWGQKDEATATWFGLLTKGGETTPMADALEFVWTGVEPKNKAPRLLKLTSAAAGKVVRPSESLAASVEATDPDQDALTYHWWLLSEQDGRHDDRGRPIPPKSWPQAIVKPDGAEVAFAAPATAGTFRLYVAVLDGKGHAAEANVVFQVKP